VAEPRAASRQTSSTSAQHLDGPGGPERTLTTPQPWLRLHWKGAAGTLSAGVVFLAAVFQVLGISVVGLVSVHRPTQVVNRPNLMVEDLLVEDFPEDWTQSPRVQVSLHNTGVQRSVVTRAEFTVLRAAHFPLCEKQGNLILSNSYAVVLPTNPSSGMTVEVPLHQQLGPDEADRIEFRFQLPNDVRTKGDATVYLYQLKVELLHDAQPGPLSVGQVLLAVPSAPDKTYLWTKDKAADLDYRASIAWLGPNTDEVISCLKTNTTDLKPILAVPGERSSNLQKLPSILP